MKKTLNYTGETLKEKKIPLENGKIIDVYLPSPELIKAVHLAFQVNRPLLIMGEPGCGKTRLAEAVAYELHGEKMYDHFFTWNIKSTTKAQDGIYEVDTLERMYDANVKDLKKIDKYINYGKLADAFQTEPHNDQPNILLIDEIDKADIDFPNDLLLELDKKEFEVKELEKTIKATSNILIFITSNEEKELPPAFLRRCLFHFIKFPNKEDLEKIVLAHYGALKEYKHFEKALDTFVELNTEIDDKKPSTSELIDWFKMISYYNSIRDNEGLSDQQKLLIEELEKFEGDNDMIPYSQILLKTVESRNKYKENE
ncbi:MoxR family ATPase [Bernardetia sp. MNP-M8]|uniref:AAA family ATPase n=1 Tax=Bernardetia sp. MNP-M8 TaxID=3127470 RepID=UPI0030D22162